MSERSFISSALGGRPTVPYPNAGTGYVNCKNNAVPHYESPFIPIKYNFSGCLFMNTGYLLWVEGRLQGDADCVAEVRDAEDHEGEPLALSEVPHRHPAGSLVRRGVTRADNTV